ncbi:hypothetical protein AK830_g225 [Neonectria ditissima]|uniref:3-hydroxyacyl-CoA dehydrogenase C-terminal domain-containing protein n=1 Tax=Neonectria ditissima TaxID=78410 RepID=A0A0P7BHK0_9HYPO|nr:hypothetical protein AK830_g225 [Neonectria ditissima]
MQWIQDAKAGASNAAPVPKRKGRRRTPNIPSPAQPIPTEIVSEETPARDLVDVDSTSTNTSATDLWQNLISSAPSAQTTPFAATSPQPSEIPHSADYTKLDDLVPRVLSDPEFKWLQGLYTEGFEAVFGSWMGRYSCPFLFEQDGLPEKYVSISDLCCQLDQCMADAASGGHAQAPSQASEVIDMQETSKRNSLIELSLRSTIAAFSARWLPIASSPTFPLDCHLDIDNCLVVQALWRSARRDMLRIINRPSYRSMLSLFLFALTPIPVGISEDEEADGISGQVCVHAALQQVQTLRARQRNLQFSGSKVSPSLKPPQTISIAPGSADPSGFINAESVAYWAALTFDTSASLTLNCRPLLSSGLFGFEAEMPWSLVRACSKMFDETAKHWPRGTAEMTDERANQIIGASACWKLLGWKLAAVFKEALRDGHDESQVRRTLAAVVDSIKQFNCTFRPHLDECHKRIQFLGQRTKLRWFSLMLHYHLSILIILDSIEVTDRHDLLADLEEASTEAENTIMNALVFGLHTTITMRRVLQSGSPRREGAGTESAFTVPLISIDPYPHHVVASVQLMRKAIDRDLASGKITEESHGSLSSTLELSLEHLPQSSKSVQAARANPNHASVITDVSNTNTATAIEGAKFEASVPWQKQPRFQSIGSDSDLRLVEKLTIWVARRHPMMRKVETTKDHRIRKLNFDSQPSQLHASIKAIETFRSAASQKDARWGKVITHSSENLGDALRDAWLVIECVPEQLPVKRQIISELDSLAARDIIIASNSSSYSCSEIIHGLVLENQARILSAHSYWPPETCEIEIMGHEATDPSYIDLMLERCKGHGFSPFHVKTQSMGYIYNRIWAAIKREALLAAAEGAASPEEIDAIFKGVLKTPKGPFEQMDVVGLDVVLDIENHYAAARNDIPREPRLYLEKYLEKGHLGVKTGRGFFKYGSS